MAENEIFLGLVVACRLQASCSIQGWMDEHSYFSALPGAISRAELIKVAPTDHLVWPDEYYARYGRFEIDEVAHIVTHHIVNSLIPYETATVLKRDVTIDRDVLTLLAPPRDEDSGKSFNRLVWKKVVRGEAHLGRLPLGRDRDRLQ